MSFQNVKRNMSTQAAELQTIKVHTRDVTSCDFTADYILATGSTDKTVRLWEWKAGLGYVEFSFSPLTEHKYGITCVTFSPQGTMLASCSRDGNTILWSSRNGSKIHKFSQQNGDTVKVCRFLPDSCTLATGGDNGIVCIWDLINRTLIRTIQHHEDSVEALMFTADSLFLFTTCSQNFMNLYSVTEISDTTVKDPKMLISARDSHDLGILCCDISNIIRTDENAMCSYYRIATGGNDQSLVQWILKCKLVEKNNEFISEIIDSITVRDAHSSAITCVKYNYKGAILATSSLDKSVKLWDTDGKCLQTLQAHSRYVNTVSFSRDGTILSSGSNDKTVKVWNLSGEAYNLDSKFTRPCTVLSHFGSGDLKGISTISEDNIIFLKGEFKDNEVFIHQEWKNLHSAVINTLEFSNDEHIATGSGDKLVKYLEKGDDGFFKESESSPLGQHGYQVNNVTFINSSMVASCSLDGNISIWDVNKVDNSPIHIWSKSSASVKCMRANNFGQLIAAYDDGTSALWALNPLIAEPIVTYPEHAEAATSCACSPDGRICCSASHNGDFRLYEIENYRSEPVYIQEHAHDLGIQSIDFAPHHDNLPLQYSENMTCHLLGTCGNDSEARIWKILIPKHESVMNKVTCMEWRILAGHGSSLTCIRFPSNRSDIVCTTSTDMQARIWSVYSAQCLHVLEHNALVTCCSFSNGCDYLATGSLEGHLTVWKLPLQLIFNSNLTKIIRTHSKNVTEWTSEDVACWLKETFQTEDADAINRIIVNIHTKKLTGKHIVNLPKLKIFEILGIDTRTLNDLLKTILEEFEWLQKSTCFQNITFSCEIPHHFLCPITHDIMTDPVKCADGFTYERRAINEWFLSGGKNVSPMTNQTLYNNEITSNKELVKEIREFISANK